MAERRRALIVACDDYEHEGLGRLLAPAADAEALSRVLGDPQIGGFDVRVVHNEAAHVVQGEIEDLFAEGLPDDVLLLHFSGHGLKSDAGELFFAARNTSPNRLGSTAVPADFVQRCMRTSRSRSIVLLLDCCYGGAFGRGVAVRASGDARVLDSFPSGKLGGGRGRAVITASSSMEYAFEENELAEDRSPRPSVFTSAVVEGLATGDADHDEDGFVSLNELYDYVFDRVRAQNPNQTPGRDVEMQGELYLARSRRRRIRPLPIPADLEAARTDPNMYSRIGAVSELRTRLLGADLQAAVGARDALADMARNDIRFVADPAQAALDEAVVHPSESELHFGRVEQDSTPPHRMVRLLGPPIARTCVPHTSYDWIHVTDTGEGLDISVDTSQAGLRTGSIEVKGPTGEAVVTVHVEPFAPLPKPTPTPKPVPPPKPAPTLPRSVPAEPRITKPAPVRNVRRPSGSAPGPAAPPPGDARNPYVARAIPVLWALMPVLGCGVLLTPVPFAYAAIRLRDRKLGWITLAYTVLWLALGITDVALGGYGFGGVCAALLLVLAGVATVHAFELRDRVFPPPAPPTAR